MGEESGASSEKPQPSKQIELKQEVGEVAGGEVTGVKVGEVAGDLTVNETRLDQRSGGVYIENSTARGDIIAANIGAGAQDVAVGKFIFQHNVRIGTLVLPARLVLALVAVVLIGAVATWFVVVPDQMPPSNSFNVAVAEFGEELAPGQVRSSKNGADVSLWTFGELRKESKNLPEGFNVTAWHDSMSLLEKRATVGRVEGTDAATRAQNAAQLAKRLRANMVIYGNLKANQSPADFTPEFYVAPSQTTTADADEVVGRHELGSPMQVPLPVNLLDLGTSDILSTDLKPRVEALAWLIRGLTRDLRGRHDEALDIFWQAEKQLTGWQEDQGKEILYYFIGRQALFLSHDEALAQKKFKSAQDALAAAETALNTALRIKPSYARGHFLLGNVHYQKAQRMLTNPNVSTPELGAAAQSLDAALREYDAALANVDRSPGSQIEMRVLIQQGFVHRLQGVVARLRGDVAAAQAAFDLAIRELRRAAPQIPGDEYRVAAQTFLGLAATLQEQARLLRIQGEKTESQALFEEALANYDRCIARADAADAKFDAFMQRLKSLNCQRARDGAQQELEQLKRGE